VLEGETKMARYGYLDMPEGYSDVGDWPVEAICPACGCKYTVLAEDAGGCPKNDDGVPLVDCLCSEYD